MFVFGRVKVVIVFFLLEKQTFNVLLKVIGIEIFLIQILIVRKVIHNYNLKIIILFCSGKIMLRLYVEDDGKPVSDAKVNYVDSKLIDTVSTDLYGYVAIPVYGCTVALIVYHKLDNPVFKTVDLLSCTTREEKVVIKLEAKCNFNIYFENTVYQYQSLAF